MNWRMRWWLPGFVAALLTVGVPYWQIPYNKLNLPGAVLGIGLLVVFVAAAATRAAFGRPFWHVVAAIGAAVPAVVLARVAVDVARNPASHNLWPFEVVIAVLVGGAAALAGALLGSLALLLWRRMRSGE